VLRATSSFIEFIADETTGLIRDYHLVWTG
jgi:hypothetical protein